MFAIDPKGEHLITKDAGRKLLNIRDDRGRKKVLVRLITAGKWNDQIQMLGPSGFTVWTMARTRKIKPRTAATIVDAIGLALKP